MISNTEDKDIITNKQINKKMVKESSIYESAYELFGTKGIYDTSIDDIVKKAGVAKGTFYLYFKSKYDIVDRIVIKKSFNLIKDAVDATINKSFNDVSDAVIFLLNYIIEYFKNNRMLLKIIHKDLSWGIFRRAIADKEQDEEMRRILLLLEQIMLKQKFNQIDFEKNLFMIIELTGAVCYSSIILDEPAAIDDMKPVFFSMISKMISN